MYFHFIILLSALVLLIVLLFTILYSISIVISWPHRHKEYFFKHRFHYSPTVTIKQKRFPQLLQANTPTLKCTEAEIYLSVIIPAMNEKERLPIMLDECLEYLQERHQKDADFTYEVIVVDDGSTDGTAELAFNYSKEDPQVLVCQLASNIGKGGAVRVGVLCSRGKIVLFADADGATKFAEFGKLEVELHRLCNGEIAQKDPLDYTHPAIVVGSRAHLENEAIAKRSPFRTILMVGFHSIVYLFAVRTIKDTQCGFKLFSRAAAAKLFPRLHIERWAFDVELLYLAEQLNYPISEMAVQWTEIDGSKVTPIVSWIQMGLDILLIWYRYAIRQWRVDFRFEQNEELETGSDRQELGLNHPKKEQ